MTDVYVTKLSPSGALVWSIFMGGPNHDRAYAITVDTAGYVYVAGRAGRGFPVAPAAFQTTFMGGQSAPFYGEQDGFVCTLKPDGSAVVFCQAPRLTVEPRTPMQELLGLIRRSPRRIRSVPNRRSDAKMLS